MSDYVTHPSMDILSEVNNYIEGKTIVLGVTASVALYRSLDLARWLLRRGARVITVMTPEAAKLVSPEMFHWASGGPVYTGFTGGVEHISIARAASAMVVAPATLSTLAKIAHGVVDNPVALAAVSIMGYGKPVIAVPAMHGNMYESPQAREVVDRLRSQGVLVVDPKIEGGVAKYPDTHAVGRITAAQARKGLRDLEGIRALVTLGSTREWIDRVRFISNPSSGVMGLEAALELYARGAEVDVVAGYTSVEIPHLFNTVKTETTEDMAAAVEELTSKREYDAVVAAAAPVDFRPAGAFEGKIRSGQRLVLELEPTPKVLEGIARRPKVLVAFAAEYVDNLDSLRDPALEKMEKYDADLVVANRVGVEGVGFASPLLDVLMLDKSGEAVLKGSFHKEIVAAVIADEIAKLLSR
ncbi:coenzyme A biosynthesis bifunctional protein CoaBC [Aeropyrum pernix K1]|uniref:Coenzyme A biosynthesis bifunctional protein CoaBC n=1 Tax=Aeropyrum pernix (strain ATCC 700893 / DSM 11879 / JCM 9820 / NBRC 100138 / K1) TaxID=272557 RepID=Q9YAI0_AERPE|nr:bifunctional phosphopantothenoylcysteine decarboxylase/phosphopantothenate--cysteine ligase CoaBC [Aeropyrum pernix]BAA80969.2 coenzyme A biosynthesis bifunctional protein CoaBC [Aeropyrum pernix K1]